MARKATEAELIAVADADFQEVPAETLLWAMSRVRKERLRDPERLIDWRLNGQ